MTHRAPTTAPIAPDPTHVAGRAARPVAIGGHRPVDLIASPRLRGGWRAHPDRGLRLVWRFEPAA